MTKFRVFWDVAPRSHVEVDRCFRGVYCLHHQGDDVHIVHMHTEGVETIADMNARDT